MTEFLVEIKNCTRCQNSLVTMEKRRADLLSKVDEFKERKLRREERKKKWEMWKKTQAIYHQKNTYDYEKWECFTDSEDEFEKAEKEAEPVCPENDPKFAALKADMDARASRIKEKKEKAIKLKEQANKFMKKKNYLEAIRLYSEAIELTKSYKYLWTNRALAHIKRGDFQEAVNDCTRILEYSEVMEEGYTRSRDANFKAFARRAMAYKGMKEWNKALEDIEQCLVLFPGDESAELMKKDLNSLKEKYEQMEEIEVKGGEEKVMNLGNLNGEQKEIKKEIDSFVGYLDAQLDDKVKEEMEKLNYANLRKICLKENEKLKLYFFSRKGLNTIKRVFKTKAYDLNFDSNTTKHFDFVHSIIKDNDLFIEEAIKLNYPRILLKRFHNHLKALFPQKPQETEEEKEEEPVKKMSAKETQNIYRELEEITNLLVCFTENRNARLYFREKAHILTPIFSSFYQNLIQMFRKEHYLISNILNFFTNLLVTEVGVSQNELRDFLISNYLPYFFSSIGLMLKEKSLKYLSLKKGCLSFLSNLMIYQKSRNHCVKHIRDIAGHKDLKDEKKMEVNGVLFFFENLFLDSIRVLEKIVKQHGKFGENTVKYFDNIFSLILNMVYKISASQLSDVVDSMNELKLVNVVLQVIRNMGKMKESIDEEKWKILMKRGVNILSKFFKGGLERKVIFEILDNLLEYYCSEGDGVKKNELIVGETNKLLVVLLKNGDDEEFIQGVLGRMKNVNNGQVLKVVSEMIKLGSDYSLVR